MRLYAVSLERAAQKQLRAVRDRRLRGELEREILALTRNPRPPGCLKLSGYADHWRVRVGDWRIIYRIEDRKLIVVVVTLAPRGGVYR